MKRILIVCLVLAACGSAVAGQAAKPLARWRPWVHIAGPIDVVGPRADGAMVLAANGRLWLLSPSGSVRAFAAAYHSNPGLEAYIALSPGGCFGRDTVYAIRLGGGRGVTAISRHGTVRRFASISAPGLINGITFGFGGRLLVTINKGSRTTVDAIDCRGAVHVVTRSAPRVEGGITVAPASFGRFGGDLIAPDELGGGIYAVTPGGRSLRVASSGLPHGGDTGVESEAFVPKLRRFDALLSDRLTPGNPHPGDDVVLRVASSALLVAGVRSGDLLVATEGGARSDAVRCGSRACVVRHVADGPAIAHAEGHIAILAR